MTHQNMQPPPPPPPPPPPCWQSVLSSAARSADKPERTAGARRSRAPAPPHHFPSRRLLPRIRPRRDAAFARLLLLRWLFRASVSESTRPGVARPPAHAPGQRFVRAAHKALPGLREAQSFEQNAFERKWTEIQNTKTTKHKALPGLREAQSAFASSRNGQVKTDRFETHTHKRAHARARRAAGRWRSPSRGW